MPISQNTDKDDVKVKGDDGTHEGKLIGAVDDCLKVHVCNSDDIDGGDNGDYYLRLAKGLVPGATFVQKFGRNPQVDNGGFEPIWDGATEYAFQTSAQTLLVKSSDRDDDDGDTGARTMRIEGLDANYDEISETITLNGQTNVTSANSYLRVHRMYVLTAGSSEQNEGDITARFSTTNDLGAKISRNSGGENQTLMAIYTVPAGKTAYLKHWFFGQKNQDSSIRLRVREHGKVFQTKAFFDSEDTFDVEYTSFLKIPEKSDILIDAKAQTGSHEMNAGFDLILVDNA